MSWRSSFHNFSRQHAIPQELRQFFYGIFFYRMASGLISLAGPIFLFLIGQEFRWLEALPLDPTSKGLFFVFSSYLLERLIILALSQPLANRIPRIGFHTSMVIGLAFLGGRTALYDFFLRLPLLWPISMALGAVGIQFFWIGYHTYFAAEAKTSKLGSEVGGVEFLSRLAQVLAPLFGALLAGAFGFAFSLWAGIALYAVAIVFLLHLPRLSTRYTWQWSEFFSWVQNKRLRLSTLGLAAYSWEELGVIVFWPIFLFVTFQNIESVGYILSAASFISLMFIYLSGWVFDHRKQKAGFIQKGSGILLSLLWIPRLLFATSPLVLVLNDAVDRLTHSVYATLFYASMLFCARGKHVYTFFVNRQIAISLFWSILLLLSIGLLFIQWNWTVLFLSFLGAGMLSLLFSKEVKKFYLKYE